jgi:hypothetical protein
LDIVQLLHGILNLTLVRLDINDEHEGVVLFDLLHRGFRVEGSSTNDISLPIERDAFKLKIKSPPIPFQTHKKQHSRNNSPKLIHPRRMWDALAWVLGVPRETKGLGAVERHRVPCLARRVPMRTL